MGRLLVGVMSNGLVLSGLLSNGLVLGAVVLGGLGCDTVRLCADNLCEQEGIDAGRSGVGIGETPIGARDAALQPTGSVVPGESPGETPWGETSDSLGADATSHEPCEPGTNRGCDGETPWCLGEGERSWDGGLAHAPRCVECEEDSHCAFP